jgi:hypothetical protein
MMEDKEGNRMQQMETDAAIAIQVGLGYLGIYP